jgi:hypothetical protein
MRSRTGCARIFISALAFEPAAMALKLRCRIILKVTYGHPARPLDFLSLITKRIVSEVLK